MRSPLSSLHIKPRTLFAFLFCYCLCGIGYTADEGTATFSKNTPEIETTKNKTIGEHFLSLNPFKKAEKEQQENEKTAFFSSQDPTHRDLSAQIDKQHKVEDLAYGEILLPYFTNENYNALVTTRVMQEQGRLNKNKEHANLLLAQLYIIEGLPELAKQTLENIARNRISNKTRHAALFQLVRIHIYQGNLDKAKHILEKEFGPLESHWELERKVLLANIYAFQKNKDAVEHTLIGVKPEITRNAYIKYNLASAGLYSGREEFALPIMLDLTQSQHNDLESRSLKDFANLNVGLHHLKQEKLEKAKTYFEAISYIGPHSSAALYYIAWIEMKQEEYKTAFAYWADLSKRNPADPFVGESYLTRPYSLEKLGSTHLALNGYLRASDIYEHLIQDVEHTIEVINSPGWLNKFHPGTLESIAMREKIKEQPGWIETETNEINFLIGLYSSDSFAVLHQNHWELELLKQKLMKQNKAFKVFQLQKDTHNDKYDQLIPEARDIINSRQLTLINDRLKTIENEIETISKDDNFFAAPNAKQLERLRKIKYLHSILDEEPNDMYQTQRRYLAYLEGINAWEMSQGAPERQWKIREEYKSLNKLLEQTQKHKEQIQLGIQNAKYYDKLMPKLTYFSKELDVRLKQLELLSLKHQKIMRKQAINILEDRKKEYKTLKVKAMLAAARLQDSIVTGGNP